MYEHTQISAQVPFNQIKMSTSSSHPAVDGIGLGAVDVGIVGVGVS
jgi:hypothetical protein